MHLIFDIEELVSHSSIFSFLTVDEFVAISERRGSALQALGICGN
jgi:hypothetical protein